VPFFYGETVDVEFPDKPVPYVSIKLIGPPDYFVGSNHQGKFKIDVPAGTYNVSVRHVLYRPINEVITIDRDTYRKFKLHRMVV